jgi:hypothetical protein
MPDQSLDERAQRVVADLLRRENRAELERYRFHGSANRVYFIPLGEDGDEFVVVKVLPSRASELKIRFRRWVRNRLNQERVAAGGRDRAWMEVQRYREWERAGLRVPRMIKTELPDVRIIHGLPFPTFYTILTNPDYTDAVRLHVLRQATRSLCHQHETALQRGQASLIHHDPGPWNIMFDLENDVVYWYDLEHPAEVPGMAMEELIVRALRIFFTGVLEYMSGHIDDVVSILVEEYRDADLLRRLADAQRASQRSLLFRVLQRTRPLRKRYALRRKATRRLVQALERRAAREEMEGAWALVGSR